MTGLRFVARRKVGLRRCLHSVISIAERESSVGPGDVIRLLLSIAFPAEDGCLPTETRHSRTVVSSSWGHSIVGVPDDGNVGLREIEKELVASCAAWNESHFVSSIPFEDDCN